MVDVASPQTMPSEAEVHVARSFLSRILRSSMRKDDPGSRPHSWHSSKLTEEESALGGCDAASGPAWEPGREPRPDDPSTQADQNTRDPHASQLSSLISMERPERPSHHPPPGRLSPPKHGSSADPLPGAGSKRDSAFSCFSGGSGALVRDSSGAGRRGTTAESVFFRGLQSEGPQQDDRARFLQLNLGTGGRDGPWAENQPIGRVSIAGRPSAGPVWQVPEKKSQSPPPPAPPLRSDSFAAMKVFPYPDGPSGPARGHGRSSEKLTDGTPSCFRPAALSQLHQNKLFSLSSGDVTQPHHAAPPSHQRQHSDESPAYLHARAAPPTQTQSVGSYYRSLQDLPTNAGGRKPGRQSTPSPQEGGGQNRYHSLVGKHPLQTPEKTRQSKPEGWRADVEKLHRLNGSEPGLQGPLKTKYSTPPPPRGYGENQERGGHLGNSLQHDQQTRGEGHPGDMKRFYPTHQSHDLSSFSRLQDLRVPQEDHRISPLKTPLLHFLSQESRSLAERQPASTAPAQDASDNVATGGGKANRRGDRYATTLRKEIQQKRAQLQKSRSAATLTWEDQESEDWRSTEASASSGASFSNTYKDHLKEAQARVLQATSFQRRDLEPLGPEPSVLKTSSGRVRGRRRFHPAKRTHSFSEPDKMDKVGVEEQRKFFEGRPTFSRPTLKTSRDTNLSMNIHDEDKPGDRPTWRGSEEAPTPSDTNLWSPGPTQVLLDQQRLGTFAEYQATWTKQKKSSEAKTQGRFHSAENILDTSSEEKTICIHERSRSSPSADFYSQKIPPPWRDPQQIRFPSSQKAEHRSPDHSRHSLQGLDPGLPDHRSRPDPAGPNQTAPSPGRRSVSPGSASRPRSGPPTTPSSQEFSARSHSDPAALQPPSGPSSDTRHHAVSSSGPAPGGSPRLSAASGPDRSEGGAELREEPPSSCPAAALPLPGSDPARSPSPQLAPPRLTDKPPAASPRDDSQFRSEDLPASPLMDASGSVRKVPVKIVHTDTSSDRRGHAYLPQVTETAGVLGPPPRVPSLDAAERPATSLFSAYTRPAPRDLGGASAPDQESGSPGASEEDAKREELARDIMGKDKSLVDILDQSGRKTTMDLMEGLFPPEQKILEGNQQRRRTSAGSRMVTLSPGSTDRREEEDVSSAAAASLVPGSSYYSTSAPKAELLIKMKDMQDQLEEQDSEDELDVDLATKKQELIFSLARKLEVLREARRSLQEDVEDNEALGGEVEAAVQRRCRPNQLDKFRMFVGDLDKVVSLLLSLSGRLARVENALNSLEDQAPPEEKRTLTEKRKLLMRQHEDAKELKENLDRRERLVSAIMEAHLDAESLDDYRHFVKMKSALVIEQRKLEDKVKLGEEQLKCLMDSLPPEQRPQL